MKHFFFSLFLMLFAGTMSCQAYSKQLIKANKALLALEKNANASLKDHQIVVDQLSAVINTTKDIDDKCEASLELAEAYSVHVPVQFRDYAKAADYYKKALELICENYNSDADDERETVKKLKYRAFYNTAYYCYYKNSPTQDLGKALDYFVEAAEYNPSANSQVGEIYEFGVGCDIDSDMAMEAYTVPDSLSRHEKSFLIFIFSISRHIRYFFSLCFCKSRHFRQNLQVFFSKSRHIHLFS